MRKRMLQISGQVHVLRRDVDRNIQACLAPQVSAQLLRRGSHESAFSLHGHPRPGPTLGNRNRLSKELGYLSPAFKLIRWHLRLWRRAALFRFLLFHDRRTTSREQGNATTPVQAAGHPENMSPVKRRPNRCPPSRLPCDSPVELFLSCRAPVHRLH